MWYRLQNPPPRSTPDPLPGQAFMPLLKHFLLDVELHYKRVKVTKGSFGDAQHDKYQKSLAEQ